ncbi:helix-turn-helix domain-containing protein [Pseudoclavibacter sp. 13-3]|uniref:helix-turn-helix domain-containing protein n=1 Tax=Pseudoclavibacter sp. 13-3 TaxID=2901228 RepID=UPI001E485EA4|nr:PucR family transcriptional regulator [Pseudoclavibacter sp. 13-3]MCD7101326.1 PucR family transcriptional regulator [Pseudoclavibacter sp. 13-3]
MSISLNDVIAHFGDSLQLLAGVDDGSWHEALEASISWPAYTNLADPSPYLRGGELVLTTGPIVTAPTGVPRAAATPKVADGHSDASSNDGDSAHEPLAALDADAAERYVRGLRDAGAAGILLGPVHPEDAGDATAAAVTAGRKAVESRWAPLIGACEQLRMPLLWSDRLVFIEFVRELGGIIRREQEVTAAWLADAQQRITDAALTDEGPAAVVAQLAHEIGAWVVCFDDLARPVYGSTQTDALRPAQMQVLRASAVRVLDAGLRGAMSIDADDVHARLQTLGPSHGLLGAVAMGIGRKPLSADAQRQLLARATALLSLSLVRTQEVRRAEAGLSTAVLRLLLSGAVGAAHRTAAPFAPLPDAPIIVVAACADSLSSDQVVSSLERAHRGVRSLTAVNEGTAVMIIAHHDFAQAAPAPDELRMGVSQAVLYESVQQGFEQAMAALRQAVAGDDAQVRYQPVVADSMVDAIQRVPGLDGLARRLLEPLLDRDGGRADDLVVTLRAWLDAGGQWEAAAARLQVHRHTLRSRIERCARVLQVDLRDPRVRQEVWLALQTVAETDQQ